MNYKKLVSAISAVTLLAGLAVVPNAMAEYTSLDCQVDTIYKAEDLGGTYKTNTYLTLDDNNKNVYEDFGAPFGEFESITLEEYNAYTVNPINTDLNFNLEEGEYRLSILCAEFNDRYATVKLSLNGSEPVIYHNGSGSGYNTFGFVTSNERKMTIQQVDFGRLSAGNYTINLSPSIGKDRVQGILAVILEDVTPEPVLTDPTAEVTDVVTSNKGDGDVASAVKASVTPNDYSVTGLTWTFTDTEMGTGTYETTKINISGQGAVDYVLYINGYLVQSEDSVSVAVSSKAPVSAIN